jgi:aryl-alcohol dehydrogenase-like predicted oxidoreductase
MDDHMFWPRRELGKTGFKATILGIGDLADREVPIEECVATVGRALDAGLNVIDTAPCYEDGYSEEIVGRALEGRRGGVFVIDKIDHLDRPVAEQTEESLARLRMDSTDAFVFHGPSTGEAWDAISRPGGRMEELAECVREGKCRFKGISSHSPDVLREAVRSGRCDVVLFPVGPYVDGRYIDDVLPLARERRVGTVCFKAFGAGKLLGDTEGYGRPLRERPRGKLSSGGEDVEGEPGLPHLTVKECVRYALSCDPDVALLGLSFPNEQDAAFEAAAAFTPMTPSEMADCRRRASEAVRGKGCCWWNPGGN